MEEYVVGFSRKEKILETALKQFYEKGYDMVTVDEIMEEVGEEIGWFYNYFDGKEDVFNKALEMVFEGYEEEGRKCIEKYRRSPFRLMSEYFAMVGKQTALFRDRYQKHMHFTMVWAMKQHTTEILTPYVKKIIEILMENGASPIVDIDTAARFIAGGVGNIILNVPTEEMDAGEDIRKCVNFIMGIDPKMTQMMFPDPVTEEDIKWCTRLLQRYGSQNQYITKDIFERELREGIADRSALKLRFKDKVIGVITYDIDKCLIKTLVLKERYIEKGIAQRLIISALGEMPMDNIAKVAVSDPEGVHAQIFKSLGFVPAGKEEVDGYMLDILERKVYVKKPEED